MLEARFRVVDIFLVGGSCGCLMEYLEKHNIYSLIDVLGASLFYSRPDDPVQFILEELTTLQRLRQGAQESSQSTEMFSDSDLETLFSMFSKKMDWITVEQAMTGLFLLTSDSFIFLFKPLKLSEFLRKLQLERHRLHKQSFWIGCLFFLI